MLERRSLWGGFVGLGATSVLTGLGILATNVTQADHRFGWALLVVGAVAMLVGGVMYFVTSGRFESQIGPAAQANQGGLAAAVNVTSHQQSGGQTGHIIFNAGPAPEVEMMIPILEFGDPFSETIGIYRDASTPVANARIWRVPLLNVVDGSKGTNVTPQLAR